MFLAKVAPFIRDQDAKTSGNRAHASRLIRGIENPG